MKKTNVFKSQPKTAHVTHQQFTFFVQNNFRPIVTFSHLQHDSTIYEYSKSIKYWKLDCTIISCNLCELILVCSVCFKDVSLSDSTTCQQDNSNMAASYNRTTRPMLENNVYSNTNLMKVEMKIVRKAMKSLPWVHHFYYEHVAQTALY